MGSKKHAKQMHNMPGKILKGKIVPKLNIIRTDDMVFTLLKEKTSNVNSSSI